VGSVLVLDFDGVICDSIDECSPSSWAAFHRLYRGADAGDPTEASRGRFARLRPFIRTGEDFLIIQGLLWRGQEIASQEGFDEEARRVGEETRALYRRLFYQARTELLDNDRARWMGLNHLYPHMREAFRLLPPDAALFILSTKEPRFIAEILAANGVLVPEERILLAEAEPKLVTVEKLRARGGFADAVFVEDQIDAIRGNANGAIRVYLASWGYVKPAWLESGEAPVIDPPGLLALVRDGDWSPSSRMAGGASPAR
jgi:phosphoglycolate phosphatase-like HAD superfamily hydrolase